MSENDARPEDDAPPVPGRKSLADSLRVFRERRTLVMLALGFAFTHWRMREVARIEQTVSPLRVGLVQSNVERHQRLQLLKPDPSVITRGLLDLSRLALRQHPDLDVLVWPEAELTHPASHPLSRPVRDFARDHQLEIWTGGPHYGKDSNGVRRKQNSA